MVHYGKCNKLSDTYFSPSMNIMMYFSNPSIFKITIMIAISVTSNEPIHQRKYALLHPLPMRKIVKVNNLFVKWRLVTPPILWYKEKYTNLFSWMVGLLVNIPVFDNQNNLSSINANTTTY